MNEILQQMMIPLHRKYNSLFHFKLWRSRKQKHLEKPLRTSTLEIEAPFRSLKIGMTSGLCQTDIM